MEDMLISKKTHPGNTDRGQGASGKDPKDRHAFVARYSITKAYPYAGPLRWRFGNVTKKMVIGFEAIHDFGHAFGGACNNPNYMIAKSWNITHIWVRMWRQGEWPMNQCKNHARKEFAWDDMGYNLNGKTIDARKFVPQSFMPGCGKAPKINWDFDPHVGVRIRT